MGLHRRPPDAYLLAFRHENGRHYRSWYRQRPRTVAVTGLALGFLVAVGAQVTLSGESSVPDIPILYPVVPQDSADAPVQDTPVLGVFMYAVAGAPRSIRDDSITTRTLTVRRPGPASEPVAVAPRDVRPDPPRVTETVTPVPTPAAVILAPATPAATSAPEPTPSPTAMPSLVPAPAPTPIATPTPRHQPKPTPTPTPTPTEIYPTLTPTPTVTSTQRPPKPPRPTPTSSRRTQHG